MRRRGHDGEGGAVTVGIIYSGVLEAGPAEAAEAGLRASEASEASESGRGAEGSLSESSGRGEAGVEGGVSAGEHGVGRELSAHHHAESVHAAHGADVRIHTRYFTSYYSSKKKKKLNSFSLDNTNGFCITFYLGFVLSKNLTQIVFSLSKIKSFFSYCY